MGRRVARRVRRLGTPRYWRFRQRRESLRQRWWARAGGARSHFRDLRGNSRASAELAKGSLGSIVIAVLGIAAFEALSVLARGTSWGAGRSIFAVPDQAVQDPVSAFVGATAAIAATLLGLYYATVGVIASTIYKSEPGTVRDLFIRERSSEAYLKVVILTTAGAISVLLSRALGHEVAGLTLAVLGVLAGLTAVGLVVVAKRLFDYFDPSKLSAPLLEQVANGIRVATGPKTRAIPRRQTDAHFDAYRGLASFKHLVAMVSQESLRNSTAPVNLTRQLIAIVGGYSGLKYAIPTDSNWWDRVPRHQNWLTIDSMRLEMALNTSVGAAPELQPDYLWFESKVARLLRETLSVAFRAQAGANALSVSESMATLVANLTVRLQIQEALTLEAAWDDVVSGVTMTPQVAATDADEYEVRLNQMAAAESLVRPLTMMLLGLSRAAERIAGRDLEADFEAAISDPAHLYRANFPTETRKMLETFSNAIKREEQVEGMRVTPSWWIAHLASRSMSEALLATETGVLGLVKSRTIGQVDQFRHESRPDLAAVTAMASLELFNKIEFHQPIIRRAEEHLISLRNINTSIEGWPERTKADLDPANEHTSMVERLAELLPELRSEKFDPREPDLYGQSYQFVVEGAFTAILDGDTARGLTMYTSCVAEMDHARIRIAADLDGTAARAQVMYAVEPIITVMDLAGYALIMHELDGDGIWIQIKAMWDRLLGAKEELAQFLLSAAMFVDSSFAMTPGGHERGRRQIGLSRVFEERGIGAHDDFSFMRDRAAERPHASPVISAMAPGHYGIHDDLYILFIADYLREHLPADTDIGHRAMSIAEQIARFSANRADEQGGE